jgi:hypothetical protein
MFVVGKMEEDDISDDSSFYGMNTTSQGWPGELVTGKTRDPRRIASAACLTIMNLPVLVLHYSF